MTIEDFVDAIKMQTSDAAVRGTIELLVRPPGRKPREKLVRLSEWFNRLGTEDRDMLTGKDLVSERRSKRQRKWRSSSFSPSWMAFP